MRWLLFQIKWWRWFLSYPGLIRMRLAGADRESVKIAIKRHEAKEPKRG